MTKSQSIWQHRDAGADPVTLLQRPISICPFSEQHATCTFVTSNSLHNPPDQWALPSYFIPLKNILSTRNAV